MKANVGGADRVIRIVVGLAVIGWGIYAKNWWGALGLIPLLTGLFRFCGLYPICGMNTCAVKEPAK
ncbi:MAG: DUF2892 domain-containing protein [Calditrichaeota bacterium]|nr:DUF2892 domain-containing protein [Calditrichota bacterium]MCB9367369.1 DUF2892 domain-containing protein [Calditrichota bacterium]MCB9391335.1 DUF2892 domain-containing protein [Calditrichota bacterium]